MRIVCEREKMALAFQAAASVATSRSPKEILNNVKLEATEQGTVLMATNMEVGIRLTVPNVTVEEGGLAILPIAQVGSVLREFTAENLTLTANESTLTICGGTAEVKLQIQSPDDFPQVEPFSKESYFTVAPSLLHDVIQRTLIATNNDNSRYALGGIRLETDGTRLFGVGTDGRRLSKMEGPIDLVGGYEDTEAMIIVPSASMQMVQRLLCDGEEPVCVAPGVNDIVFSTEQRTLYVRLLEGRFPQWRDALPRRESCITIDLPVGPFFAALRQAAIAADSRTHKLIFSFGQGTLSLAGQAADVGQSRIEMPIEYNGAEIVIGLAHTFVADVLRVLDPQKNVTLEIVNADEAVLCRTDDGLEYVIMPLALNASRTP